MCINKHESAPSIKVLHKSNAVMLVNTSVESLGD